MRSIGVFALLVSVALGAVLTGNNQPTVVDPYTQVHPVDDVYLVWVHDESVARRDVDLSRVSVVFDQRFDGRGGRLLGVRGHTEALPYDPAHVVIAPNQEVRAAAATPWNLDRLDERQLADRDGTWVGPATGGQGVVAWIVDSGVDTAHPEFAPSGRAVHSFSAFGSDHSDRCGHGTHVAGIVGGREHGVAHGVQIRSVKVLSGSGCGGTTLTLADGLAHILSTMSARGRNVINLSLGYVGENAVISSMVASLVAQNAVIVAAAGNDGNPACSHHPSALPGVLAIVATDRVDAAASFNNYGTCTDLFAPGVAIRSAEANTDMLIDYSGTSMAAPHVTGVAALLWQQQPSAPAATVVQQLLDTATQGVITNTRGSPNLMLFWGGPVTLTTTTTTSATTTTTGVPPPPPPPRPGSGTTGTSSGSHSSVTVWFIVLAAAVVAQMN